MHESAQHGGRGRKIARYLWTGLGAAGLTFALFLVLPLMQAIGAQRETGGLATVVETAAIPPPPPVLEEPEEEEPEEEEEPPALEDEAPLLDLAQLELALGTAMAGDYLAGDFAIRINAAMSGADDVDALFSMADLDQEPRVIYQPSPQLTAEARRKAPGTVYVIFAVGRSGQVEEPKVQSSSDPVFEAPALAAIRQWKFEPGRRNGEPVRFRMRVPITFPKR